MAPPKTAKKTASGKKEKLFHPQSRKAEQLNRIQVRKNKLGDLIKTRHKRQGSQINLYCFFYHAMPPEGGVLSVEDLHSIVQDVWLTRHDSELEAERAARRKGRPKSVKEQKLEEVKLRETEEYRTGLEIVDLTHPENVELFRRWDQQDAPFIEQLRFIRISSSDVHSLSVSRPGKHRSLIPPPPQDTSMDEDEAPLLLDVPMQ